MSETVQDINVAGQPVEVELKGDEPKRYKVELTKEQIGALMGPISGSRVATRNQGGATLSYVEAWDIKTTLIRIFGFGGFSAEVIDSRLVQIRETNGFPQHANKDGSPKTPQIIAQSTVRLTLFGIGPLGQDAVYTETAIGANSGWDIGDVADNAIKSASSDALKRCAIYLGTQFGLSLYNNGDRKDVVRVMLEPEQAALWKAFLDEHRPEFDEKAQSNFGRALGAAPPETIEEADLPAVSEAVAAP